MKPVLKIYVAQQCPGCAEARQTARQIQQDYPGVTVQVIDIAAAEAAVPEEVFATPTYLLNNRVVSLGNPGPEDIAAWLKDANQTEVNL